MTAVSKNVYFDFLDDVVDKYNNTYHRTIKMKPIDVDPNLGGLFSGLFVLDYPLSKTG